MKPHRPLRAAIVGAGMIGSVHTAAARSAGAEVIGVLASNPERSRTAAAAMRIPRGYASIEDVLADVPDIVHICTPNDTHYPLAMQVMAAGTHVICEKPLATSVPEAEELACAAKQPGLVATIPYVYRYHPLVRELRARRIQGELGDIKLVHGSYLQDWLLNPLSTSWRVSATAGGRSRAFADIGSHWCDLAEFILGEKFTSLTARTSIAYPTRPAPAGTSFSGATQSEDAVAVDTEDVATVTLTTESGVLANTVISQVSGGRKNRLWIEIDGSKSSAVFDQENPEQVWIGTESGATILRRGEGNVSAAQSALNLVPAGHSQGYTNAFNAFVRDTYSAVAGGEPDSLPTFEDGLRSVRLIEAVLASADTRSWQDLS